jgi:hypothetical protein
MTSLTKFQENLRAGKEIISIYCDNSLEVIRYVMLLAQMQSGKTFVYTFVMCEMFRQRKVEKVIIFSGNAEVALREQTRRCMEDEEYQIFYKEYLISLGVQEDIIEYCWEGLKASITRNFEVIWGTALKKRMAPKTKTLFIWDESHFAQDQGMCPDKFLDQMGILPNGDWRPLRDMDNYVLSVSATSFSEASDAIHQDQCKAVVTFSPSSAYMSVKKMKENGMIVSFEHPRSCVLEQMKTSVQRVGQRKYGIIRIGHNVGEGNGDEIFYKKTAEQVKWDIKLYYETSDPRSIDSLECLNHEPDRNTLILVKDHCRMGQQLPKQNISFVIETAVISRTDVLLQGLLGRMCGYHNYTGIRICLRKSFVESTELDKYLQFVKKSNSGMPIAIPSKGNNIVKDVTEKKVKKEEDEKRCGCGYNHGGCDGSTPIIPIRITSLAIDGSEELDLLTLRTKGKINAIRIAIEANQYEDLNSEEIQRETLKMIEELPEDSAHWVFKSIRDTTAKNIAEAILERKEKKLGSSAGVDFGKIGVYIAKDSFQQYGIKKGSIFIFRQYLKEEKESEEPEWKKNIPKTTRKEVFCRVTEMGNVVPSNGQCSEDLDPETANDVKMMKNAIMNRVERSLQRIEGLIISRNITSNKSVGSRWSGIYVSNEVLEALTKGGRIYEDVKAIHGVILKCEKQRGKKVSGEILIRLIQISW